MKSFLKITLALGAVVLIALSVHAISKRYHLDRYDTMKRPQWKVWEKRKWTPYVPGTEGQKEVRVQVLDATTMRPIEGAIVVGGYYGPGNSGGKVCVKSESAISDAEGWAALPNDQDPRVGGDGTSFSDLRGPKLESAYKRGYQLAQSPRHATTGGHNEWYIKETTPVPYYRPGFVDEYRTSSRKFSDSHKAVLMETKERSRIYLMPSTAQTKEERSRELNWMDGGSCGFKLPFRFSKSEGALAAWKAIYQEKLDIGFTNLSYDKDMLDRAEESYRQFRQGFSWEMR